ncbi:hypothetical protein A0O28_0007590 [Trichoderma guizhouense]|uniref:SSCRP protein n=1 Tax=Trichoderma guizhouense TaxID=1491466 RepID=A0A1T3CHV9_9HYPO|nr:hypothetical protein A0O28_0007590 [Trichoderma guizhouense]
MVTSSLIACLVVLAGVAVAYPAPPVAESHAVFRRCGPLEVCPDSKLSAAQESAPVRRCGPLEICNDAEPVAPVRRCLPLEVCTDSEPVAPVQKRCGPLEVCVDSESAVEQ